MIARFFEHPAFLAMLILLVVVLFGWKRLPDMARSLGRSSRILKSEIDELKAESNVHKSEPVADRSSDGDQSVTRVEPIEPVTPVHDTVSHTTHVN